MKTFHFRIHLSNREFLSKTADSNNNITAINMVLNQLSKEEQEKVVTVEIVDKENA